MKKWLFLVGFLLLTGVALAADLTSLSYQFPVLGTPVDNTFKATLDNVAVSVQTLAEAAGITWVQSGQTPHGMWLSVETQNARFGATGTDADATTGHVLAKDLVPIHFSGAGFINALKLSNAVAESNAVVQITLER